MQKIIRHFAAILIFISIPAISQTTKSNWLVGGTASYQSLRVENVETNYSSKYTYVEAAPNIGYFVLDNFATGLKGTFYYSPYDGAYNIGYAVGPFVKYYFLKPEKTINVFSQLSFQYSHNTNSNHNLKSTSSERIFGVRSGVVFFFNSSVGIELSAEYSKGFENSILENEMVLIGLGFQIHLQKE